MGPDGKIEERASNGMTFEQFYLKYDYVVRAVIQRYIPRDLGEVDDIAAEIWTQFYAGKDGVSYLEIYDPEKGAPTTFMWEFSRKRCLQYLSRSHRTPTARAYSIQSQPNDAFIVGIVDPETTDELGFDEYQSIEFADLIRRAEQAIHSQRRRGKRDLPWVWYLVVKGYRQDMIAQEMNLSEGTISICMDLIREIPEVRELRDWAVENGLIRGTALQALG